MVADLSLAERQFRNTLQPPLGGPWLQPKAQGALIAFLLLSHLSKPNPLLSADLQTGSPPQNPGHQTNTDQHLHLLPSGSSPGSCQHRNPSPTLSTMRLHLTPSAPTDLKRQGLESTGTQTTSSTSLSHELHGKAQLLPNPELLLSMPKARGHLCSQWQGSDTTARPILMLTCLSEKLMRNKDMSCASAQGCERFTSKMQPEVEFATQCLTNYHPHSVHPLVVVPSLLGFLLFHVMEYKTALRS